MPTTFTSGPSARLTDSDYAPRWFDIAILAALLALFCLRVWGLGVMHTDDAHWILRMYEGLNPAADWARGQGRVWALPVGAMMQYTLMLQNSVLGELLRLGSFVLFFAAFHWMVRAYCGARMAMLSATLFLAFAMVRWDGSLLTTYPMLSWISGSALVCAALLGRAYVRDGKAGLAVGAALALYFSFFSTESVTVLCAVLFLLSIAANAVQLDNAQRGLVAGRIPRRTWHLLLVLAGVALLYATTFLAWRALYPGTYDGFDLAPFSLPRIATALAHFSTSGSVLHDIFSPYVTVFADAFSGEQRPALYRIPAAGRGLLFAPVALAIGALLAWLALRIAGKGATSLQPSARWMALLVGLSVAILPLVPVALTSKYQGWAMELGVKAYSHTILAHFGWSLVLAAFILMVLDRLRQRPRARMVLVGMLMLVCGLLGSLAYRVNDQIVDDMRPEAGRWRIVETALDMNRSIFKAPLLWIPRLASGSWYTVVTDDYWSQYTQARYLGRTRITALAAEVRDAPGGFVLLDYAFDNHGADVITLATQFSSGATSPDPAVEKIAVHVKRPNALAFKDYVLAFEDGAGKSSRIKLTELKMAADDSSVRVLANPPADAQAIRVLRVADGREVEICATRLPLRKQAPGD